MELVKVLENTNEIAINENFIKEYKEFQKIKLAMELREKEFKEELKEAMEETGRTSILLDGFSVTYRKGGTRQTIDTKSLKEDFPEIVLPYIKETETILHEWTVCHLPAALQFHAAAHCPRGSFES